MSHKAYSISHTKLGIEIRGIDLKKYVSDQVKDQIIDDVHKHRLVIFKDQGVISAERHVEISQWFGALESTFYKHPRSPHPDVFRVSNDRSEGCTNVGRTGWHIDGSFMEKPFNYSLYHMVSVPQIGCTAFVGLSELLASLTPACQDQWDRLWMIGHNGDVIHPLIYSHPVTKNKVLCFHLGMTECFIWDYGTQNQKVTDQDETYKILREIHGEIVKDKERLVYKHHWEKGDFIISDNRAVGHEATPETQFSVSEVGLRVLHRTTVAGTSKPLK